MPGIEDNEDKIDVEYVEPPPEGGGLRPRINFNR